MAGRGTQWICFLKISVLQANFCWLEDVLRRKVLLGKRQFRVCEAIDVYNNWYVFFVKNLSSSPSTKGVNFSPRPHPFSFQTPLLKV